MVNWETGKPNARFRVLELLKHNFGPGDMLVSTHVAGTDVSAQAYRTAAGRKLLIINKRDTAVGVNLPPEEAGARMDVVDAATGEKPAQDRTVRQTQLTLAPFAVAVISTAAP
jgi:hypothetical protein